MWPLTLELRQPAQTRPSKKPASPALLAPVGKQKPIKEGIKRVVFLAHFDDQEIVKTHTAHLRLKREDCNVNDVAKLVKEYLNMVEDLVIVDSHGFEIMDTDATRGKPKSWWFRNSEMRRRKDLHVIPFLVMKFVSTKECNRLPRDARQAESLDQKHCFLAIQTLVQFTEYHPKKRFLHHSLMFTLIISEIDFQSS